MAGLPWKTKTKMKTMLVLIISVCTVSVSYANGRGDPEGISMGEIMPCMHHQLAAAPRDCFHEKQACRFHLTPRRLQPTACPHTIRQFLSLYTSEAISLSLSHPSSFLASLLATNERDQQIGGWQSVLQLFLVLRFDNRTHDMHGCFSFAWIS